MSRSTSRRKRGGRLRRPVRLHQHPARRVDSIHAANNNNVRVLQQPDVQQADEAGRTARRAPLAAGVRHLDVNIMQPGSAVGGLERTSTTGSSSRTVSVASRSTRRTPVDLAALLPQVASTCNERTGRRPVRAPHFVLSFPTTAQQGSVKAPHRVPLPHPPTALGGRPVRRGHDRHLRHLLRHPGRPGPARLRPARDTRSASSAPRTTSGLDRPVYVQYGKFLGG